MKPLSRVWSLLLCLYLLLNIKPTAGRCLNHRDEVSPKRYLYYGEQTLDLRIEMSERVSHQLVSEILKILLEEVAGYANVSLIKKDDLMNATVVLNRLSGCQNKSCRFRQSPDNTTKSFVPNTMVNLEVWTGPGFNMEEWTTHSAIEDCGPLGPIGRFGWFIPSNLATDEWQKHHIIDHWRSLQEEDVAKIFNLAEDYDKIKSFMKPKKIRHKHCDAKECEEGFYRPKICRQMPPCATLLASHPDFSLRMIRDQIDILKLRVEVAWIGNALDGYVTSRYLENKPVLFFNWKPSILTSGGNFTNIAFPQCEDLPISFPFPTNCEFEINQIQKLAWSELNNAAPEAMEIIRKITFDQNQYKDFLEEAYRNVTSKNVSGMACDWLVGNERIWRHWIPEKIEKKPIIYIGGIFPMSGINYSSRGIIPSVTMAIEAINKNQSILQHYSLQLLTEDGRCSPDYVMRAFINYVTSPHYQRMAGILGPACSDTVEPIAGVAKHFHTIIISYSAEGAIPFSNMKEFPYFFRTIPSNRLFKYVYLQLFRSLEWTRVAALTMDGMKYPEYLSLTQDYLQKNGINFIANRKLSRELQASSMSQPLEDLKKKKARIIIGDFYDYTARMVMCEAYKQGMTARNGYVWFLPMWFQKNWYDTDYHNTLNETYPAFAQVPCSTAEMIRAINGHLGLVYSYYGQDSDLMQEGISVGEWRTRYKKRVEHEIREDEISDYAGYAYDAVWVYAYALDKLLSRNHSYIATLHTEKTAKMYVDILNQTNIDGVSGPIRFLGPTRLSVINVLQWVDNKTRLVGRYIPNSLEVGNLELNTSTFTWLIHNGKKPGDGREGSDTCALEGLRQMLDVDCEVAIVVANILGFGLFALLMILCFIFFKRRYERKVKLTEARMRELGLTTSTTMLTLDEWEIPRDRVVLNRKLGEGAFGTVYGGEAFFGEKGWVPVAVKTLKVGSTVEEKLDFLSEAEMMKRFDHKNVVCLLGVCTRGEPVYTIMEFMLYGDLKTYLLARRYMVNEKTLEDSDEVSNRRLTSMALDVARGLSYLAELKYVHRDLACRNCLVNSNRVVKIGDFGMTRPMYDSDYYRFNKKGMLPVRWMAPESLADGIFTPMSDVWSYGVLLYEIITFGSFPFQGLSNNQVLDFVKSGNTLSIPNGCKPQLEALLQSCWMRNAQDRPTASGIVEQLANNPRLVSPCLDLDPLASVEIEGTDSLEFQLPERPRKYSVSMNNKLVPNNRRRSGQIDLDLLSHSGTQESMPMVVCTGNGGPVLPEPNKNINTWCQNPYQSRYVTLQHNDDKPDGDYCNELPKELWQNVTCL